MIEATQAGAEKPALTVSWDAPSQSIKVNIDPEQVKHWSFAKMLCDGAGEICSQQVKMAAVAQMQAMQSQQEQNQRLARSVLRSNGL